MVSISNGILLSVDAIVTNVPVALVPVLSIIGFASVANVNAALDGSAPSLTSKKKKANPRSPV